MKSIKTAFINNDVDARIRIFEAFYVVHFIRIWKFWVLSKSKKFKADWFLTQNVHDSLEINLVFLVKMLVSNFEIEDKTIDLIHMMSSQIAENFFRKLRSYTGMESTVVNCSAKSFMSRVHLMQLDENLMYELKEKYFFPKHEKRQQQNLNHSKTISQEHLKQIIREAIEKAQDDAKTLGMECQNIDLSKIIKPLNYSDNQEADTDDHEEDVDFLGSREDRLNEEEISTFEESSPDAIHTIEGMHFPNIISGIFFYFDLVFFFQLMILFS